MSDDDLIARLRSVHTSADEEAAADRIEALVKERDYWIERCGRERAFASSHRVRAERLEAALRETTQVLRQCTFQYIRVEGQYLDREEVVSRADAALKGADHE